MLPVSAISDAANKLRGLLLDRIDDLEDVKQIRIGHPEHTLKDMEADEDKNHLNLFVYNVTYDGYPADGLSVDPFYVRIYCLITAVGAKNGSPSAGENDLRLVGEVMRILHEQPVIAVDDADSREIGLLQVVPHPLSLDNLNHIWSTQGETAYRLSVAYEMALAPIPLAEAAERSPLVGETGTGVEGHLDREPLPEDGFGIETSAPVVPKTTVDVGELDWAPHICFLDASGQTLNYTLLIPVSPALGSGFQLKVLIAGKPSEQVALVWETWNPDDGVWQRTSSSQNETIATDTIDPKDIDPSLAADVGLPIQDKGQAALHAERAWQRPDGATVTLRSNPLLVTVHGAST